jgi:DNA gyrase/topoisomerase IV subunit B
MQYERLSHVEHILKRPDTYVGSLPPETGHYWVREGERFKLSELSASPGLVKIFDEVLVNALDHAVRLRQPQRRQAAGLGCACRRRARGLSHGALGL